MKLIDADKLMNDVRKTITEKSGVMDWINLISQQTAVAPVVKMVEYEGEWIPEECCTFTNPLTSGGERYIDDAETPCSNCDQECSECVIQRVMDDYARVTGQAVDKEVQQDE